ncbi:acyltransferase [Clostridium perfringens]|uniref:acyltransferase n=1 Tax=Clostridium perfringens TaxID=1502 RepID=UPI00244D62D9|nr:acyltransferase [Clostridium perfringens]MDH2340211.1 acyltransferase [Clostridium perfringens]HDI3014531.1 acyltransferase [Clostridium perfringens]
MKKIKKLYYLSILKFVNKCLSGPRFFSVKRSLLNSIGIKVGINTKIVGPIYIGTEAKLHIGNNCWIGRDFKIDGNGKVIIGNKCDLAPEIIISTGSHEIGDKNRRAGEGKSYTTKIGNGTWICTRSTIIEGSHVGESCIVGAGSLVNKNINDNLLVGGVPAKILRKI